MNSILLLIVIVSNVVELQLICTDVLGFSLNMWILTYFINVYNVCNVIIFIGITIYEIEFFTYTCSYPKN